MLSLPPWVRAAWTSRSAARWGSPTEASTSLIWSSVEFVGQAVAAQQVPVAPHRLDPPQVDGHVRRHAEGPGQDVAVGVHGRLGVVSSPLRTISSARL